MIQKSIAISLGMIIVVLIGGLLLFIRSTSPKVTTIQSAQSIPVIESTLTKVASATPRFDSPLPTPTEEPTPTVTPIPEPYPDLRVAGVEPVENGPYISLDYSPDRKKALITKHIEPYGYVLLRRENSIIDTSLGDLWLLDVSSGEETQLMDQVGRYNWSPDSTRIAMINPRNEEGLSGELSVYDIATGEKKVLTQADFLGTDYKPQWTANEEIVFVRDGQLWQIHADGTAEESLPLLRFISYSREEQNKVFHQNDPTALVEFQYSHDGKQLAYTTYNENLYAISRRLWVSNSDGSNPQLVTAQAIDFRWSHNGKWLAISTFRDLNDPILDEEPPYHSSIWAIRLPDWTQVELYRLNGWGSPGQITWSPDSKSISFIQGLFTDSGLASSLWIANVEQDNKIGPLQGVRQEHNDLLVDAWWDHRGGGIFAVIKQSENLTPNYSNVNYRTEFLTLQP